MENHGSNNKWIKLGRFRHRALTARYGIENKAAHSVLKSTGLIEINVLRSTHLKFRVTDEP